VRGTVVGVIWKMPEILVKFDGDMEFKQGDMVDVELHRKKRSLNANAYFHKMVSLLAEKLGNSNAYQKNLLLRSYGQYEYIGDKIPTLQVKSEYDEAMDQREDIHLNPIGRDGEFTKYAVMRGSHTYDTKEMSRLIDGTVNECKAQGIETITDDELKRMVLMWGKTNRA